MPNNLSRILDSSKQEASLSNAGLFYFLLFLASCSAVLGGLGLYQPTKDSVEGRPAFFRYIVIISSVLINAFVTFKISKDNLTHATRNLLPDHKEEEKQHNPAVTKSERSKKIITYAISIPISLSAGVVFSYISGWSPVMPFWMMFSFQLVNQFNLNYYSATPRVTKLLNYFFLNQDLRATYSYRDELLNTLKAMNDEIDHCLTREQRDKKTAALIESWYSSNWEEFYKEYRNFLPRSYHNDNILRQFFYYSFQLINQYSLLIYYSSTFDFFQTRGELSSSVSWLMTAFCLVLFHLVNWDFGAHAFNKITDSASYISQKRKIPLRYVIAKDRPAQAVFYSLTFFASCGFFYAINLLDTAAFGYQGAKPNMSFLQSQSIYRFTLFSVILNTIVFNLMGAIEPGADLGYYRLLKIKKDQAAYLLMALKNMCHILESSDPFTAIEAVQELLGDDFSLQRKSSSSRLLPHSTIFGRSSRSEENESLTMLQQSEALIQPAAT